MKNKVIRLAVVAMLVVAMTLTMTACVQPQPSPSPSTSPSASSSPSTSPSQSTTPSTSPSESTEPTPSGETDAAKLKAAYGLELIAKGGTFGSKDTEGYKLDGATEAYGFALTGVEKLAKNVEVELKISSFDYEGDHTGSAKPTKGDADFAKLASKADKFIGTVTKAGTYNVTVTVTVTEENIDFAKFGIAKKDSQEFELEATLTIAKKAVEIKVYDDAVKVSDPSATGTTLEKKYEPITPKIFSKTLEKEDGTVVMSGDGVTALNTALGSNKLYLTADKSYDTKNEGSVSYSLIISSAAKFDEITEDNIVAFEDLVAADYTFTTVAGTTYYISSYDMNVIRDVNTSVVEIENVASAGAYTTTITDMYNLAKTRYEGLSDAQKAYYANPKNMLASIGSGLYNATMLTESNKAVSVPAFFTKINKEMSEATSKLALKNLWAEACTAANWTTYGDVDNVAAPGTNFNVKDSNAMNAYNAINAFVTANTYVDTDKNYLAYTKATELIAAEQVKAVKELIAGAIGAYNQAIANDATGIDSSVAKSVKKFISNAEVRALTNQALDAYNKLGTTLQGKLGNVDASIVNANFNNVTTNKEAITALDNMNKMVDLLYSVVNYVNIEDYANYAATQNGTPVYDRLKKLVYGVSLGFDFFGNESNYKYAVSDLVALSGDEYSESVLMAAVAEYKAWIDYTLAFEAYKKEVVAQFDALIAEEFTAENYEGTVGAATIAAATSKDNELYKALVAVIMSEGATKPTFVGTGTTTAGTFQIDAAAVSVANDNVAAINKSGKSFADIVKNDKLESIDDAKAAFEDVFNVDKAFAVYAKYFAATYNPKGYT